MSCNDLTVLKTQVEKRPNAEEKKRSSYDPSIVTDDILTDILLNPNATDRALSDLIMGDNAVIGYKSVKDKTSALKYFVDDHKVFGDFIGEVRSGREARYIAIALSHLISTAKSEDDLTRKYELKPVELEAVTDDRGTVRTSYSNMARTIGRDILKSHGYRLVPRTDKGMKAAIANEIRVGEMALDELASRSYNGQPLITVDTSSIINRNFKKPTPENIKDTRYKPEGSSTVPKIISNVKTITLGQVMHEAEDGKALSEEASTDNFRAMSKLAAVRTLVNPGNTANTFKEAQPIDEQHQDSRHTDKTLELLTDIQAIPNAITPEFMEALTDLKKRVDKEKKKSTKSTLQSLSALISSSKGSEWMFGTLDPKELEELMMGDTTGIEQQYGKSTNKVLQLVRIFDDWDNIDGNLYYTFQTAIQMRAHVVQQTLNYQSDNFLSRHIMGSPEEQILDDSEVKYLAAYLSDETGTPVMDILRSGSNKLLDKYIKMLDDQKSNEDSTLGLIASISNDMDADKRPFDKPTHSAWETMSLIKAIKDIRDGVKEGKPVKTRFMPKPDATASGALITVAQASRYGGDAAQAVADLARGKREVDGELKDFNDMYSFATDALELRLKWAKGYKGRDALQLPEKKLLDTIEEITDMKTGAVAGFRDLIKLPFTKFVYGQNRENNSMEISKEIAALMIDSNNVELMKKVLGDTPLPDTTEERRLVLTLELVKDSGIAEYLVDIVDESTGQKLFNKQADVLTDIHSYLEESVYNKNSRYKTTKIVPPLAWIEELKGFDNYDEIRQKFGTVIDKYFETVISDQEGDLTTIKKRYPNANSIRVLLQHMMDSAIQFDSIGNTLSKPEFKDYNNGIMMIHDSIGGTSKFSMALEPEYKKSTMALNSEYDFIEAALYELKYARTQVFKDQSEKDAYYDRLETELADLQEQADPKKYYSEITALRVENTPDLDIDSMTIEEIRSYDTQEIIDLRREHGRLIGRIARIEKDIATLDAIETDSDLATRIDKEIDSIEKDLPAQIKVKQKALEVSIDSLFGVKPSLLKEANTIDLKALEGSAPVEETTTSSPTTPVSNPLLPIGRKVYIDTIFDHKDFKSNSPSKVLLTKAHSKNPTVKILLTDDGSKPSYNLKTNTISLSSNFTAKQALHEMIHSATAQQIETSKAYRAKVQKLYDAAYKKQPGLLDSMFSKYSPIDKLHEFMAAGLTDSKLTTELKKISYGRRILNKIVELVLGSYGLDLTKDKSNSVYVRLLQELIGAAQYDSKKKSEDKVLGFIDPINSNPVPHPPRNLQNNEHTAIEDIASFTQDLDVAAANLIQKTIDLTESVTVGEEGYVTKAHEHMMSTSDVYKNTFNAITDQWANNTFVGKMKFYLQLSDVEQQKQFNKLNSAAHMADERKMQFETDKMNSLYKEIEGKFTKDETTQLYSLLSEVGVSNLGNGVFIDLVKGRKTVDELINEAVSNTSLKGAQKNRAISSAKDLANYYINKVAPKSFTTDMTYRGETKKLVSTLSALEAIKLMGNTDAIFKKINSSPEHLKAVNTMLELATATKALDEELYGTLAMKYDSHQGNLNHKVFEHSVETKVVTLRDIDKHLDESLGWEVLEFPTATKAGVIFRTSRDFNVQSGIHTNLKLNPDLAVEIDDKYSSTLNNAVSNLDKGTKTKIFTNDQLEKMGMKRDPIASLVKGYSHRMLLLETEAIRKELTSKYTYAYASRGPKGLLSMIEKGNHLWYVKLPDGMTLAELDPKIRAQYKLSEAQSDANGFSTKVTLVRKDISDFIEGYGELQVGKVGSTLNKAFSIAKKAILLQKIHWVIVAPAKVALDTVSNISYLLSRNVPITDLLKTKGVVQDLTKLMNLREDLLHAEFRNRAKPTKADAMRIASLEKKIANHRFSTALYRGFIQSINIDITSKNEHTSAGLNKDTGDLLNRIFRNDDESLNMAGKAIMKMSNSFVNGEDLLLKVAQMVENKEGKKEDIGNSVAKTLTDMAENIQHMKKKEDVASYIQEYLAVPGSSLVGVGSIMVQMPDVVSKIILHEYLIERAVDDFVRDNKRKPNSKELSKINEDTAFDALKSFIDYKVNVPKEIRFLEQLGITSFFSFWGRIQRVMLVSLKNNPVNTVFTLILNEMLGIGGAGTIYDANLFEKADAHTLMHAPRVTLDMMLPTKVFG